MRTKKNMMMNQMMIQEDIKKEKKIENDLN